MTLPTRRSVLTAMGAAATVPLWPALATAAAPYAQTGNAGYYRFRLGEHEITALSDGTLVLPMLDIYQGADRAELERLLAQNFLDPQPHVSVNAFLVNDGERLVLIDAGSGTLLGPSVGRLPQSIRNAGYEPEAIDAVILTHVHTDHSGGLTVDGERMFPNADIHVAAQELAFWIEDPLPDGLPEIVVSQRREAEESLRPYLDAGRVKSFEPGQSPLPGFRSMAEFGHTPGHCAIAVEAEERVAIVFWGDIVHGDHVQFAEPDVTVIFDIDQDAARATRERALEAAAAGEYLIAGAHLPFPGVGFVAQDEDDFRFVPRSYTD